MPADPVEEAAERLYALPLEEFVRERDAQAKALRKAGEKDAAAAVAKLPKPSQVAWVANQLGRAGADELLAAGDAMREAQLGGGGREALREATAAERAAVDELMRAADEHRKLSRDAKDRLRALLHALASDEELREQFAVGRIVEEPEAGGAWPSGAFTAPAPARRGAKPAGPAKKEKGESAAEKRKRQERERKAAERAKREAERQREEAERRRLERRLKAAREAADDAKVRLDAAREAYERATHEVARIEEQL